MDTIGIEPKAFRMQSRCDTITLCANLDAHTLGQISKVSATGTRTRVARVRAEYPNQLDYSGIDTSSGHANIQRCASFSSLDVISSRDTIPKQNRGRFLLVARKA